MLYAVVFVCGAAVMVLEIVGARILAPYLGTSIVVWTGLIGVILASLSLGYWQGGRLADKRPDGRTLSAVILAAAFFTGATALIKTVMLTALTSQAWGPRLAVIAATLTLFAPASVLLGMVAPFAVRLKIKDAASAGVVAGRLYALSTLGSIVGTFVAGFFLLAALGSNEILLVLAGLLGLASLAASRTGLKAKAGLAAFLCLAGLTLTAYDASLAEADIHDTDTSLSRILVYRSLDGRTGRVMRVMATGPWRVQSAMYLDDPEPLVLDYTRFFNLGFTLVPGAKSVLVLGGGGYSFPRHALTHRPGLAVTVVELDPGVTALARRYFGLTDLPGLTIHHEDARTFLNADHGPYDLIYLDTFDAGYGVPFHLVTREALSRMKALLAPGGAVIMNTIAAVDGDKGKLLRSLAATYQSIFPEVGLHPLAAPEDGAKVQNVMIVARPDVGQAMPDPGDEELRRFAAGRLTKPLAPDGMVLTDDFAPVELLNAALWREE